MNARQERNFREVLGEKIRMLRRIQDRTQMDLAKFLGLTSSGAISQVENGSKGLTVENIARTAQFFGVHPVVLMSPVEMTEDQLKMMIGVGKLVGNEDRSAEQESYYQAIRRLLADA